MFNLLRVDSATNLPLITGIKKWIQQKGFSSQQSAFLWDPQPFCLARVGTEIPQRAAGDVGDGIARIGGPAACCCQIKTGPIVIAI
jgi:hypothetical protein